MNLNNTATYILISTGRLHVDPRSGLVQAGCVLSSALIHARVCFVHLHNQQIPPVHPSLAILQPGHAEWGRTAERARHVEPVVDVLVCSGGEISGERRRNCASKPNQS